MSGPWVSGELDAVIVLYATMRASVNKGLDYNKAQMIRDARCYKGSHQPLIGRSKGSIEMKLMNVTAALEAIGRKDLSMAEHGYRPMANMQKALKDTVVAWAACQPFPRQHGTTPEVGAAMRDLVR